jgi:hypothetical protein
MEVVRSTGDLVGAGVRTAAVMFGVGGVLSLGAVLIWTIAGLATGRLPRGFGPGDAAAAIFYFVAFVPNLVIALFSLSLGTSIDVGAQLTLRGKLIGPSKDLSLFGWGAADTPWYVYLLVLIPLVACAIGGYVARHSAVDRRTALMAVATAAALLAVGLGVLAWLGEARLGASIVGAKGFGRLSANPIQVVFFGFLWAAAVGGIAALITDRRAAGGA